jgi:hypothetical protein
MSGESEIEFLSPASQLSLVQYSRSEPTQESLLGRYDIQHNDTQHNDIQHNTLSITTFIIIVNKM